MSPEYASGAPFDERADVYALGCIMFEVLTGRVPFEANSIVEVIQMQKVSEVPSLNDIIPDNDLPEDLEAIVRKALAKDPRQRFQTMEELHGQLRNLLIEHFDITPATVKLVDDGKTLPSALPAAILESSRMQVDAKKAAFNRRVFIAVIAVGSLAALVFVCFRVLKSDSTPMPISPPDITNPLGEGRKIGALQLKSGDEDKIINGKLDRYEKVSERKRELTNSYTDELAQKAYGINAETSGREIFIDDTTQSGSLDQVSLSLANTNLNKVEFARAARFPGLEALDISGARGITSAGLLELKKLEKLRTLRMDRVMVGAQELKVVAELPLENLFIINSQLSDSSCSILAKSKSLEWLDVSENPISNDGVKELATLQKLKHLRIVGTKVTAKGRVHLRSSGWASSEEGVWFLQGNAAPDAVPIIRLPRIK